MKKAINSYIAFQLLFNLLLWVPVFYEVQKQLGLNDPQIFRIQSIYYLVFCFLEFPTGYLADRFGYKASIIGGAVTLVVANLIPIVSGNYLGFLSHFCLIALARSLISGAGSAWLYEFLKSHGEESLYRKVEGDARFYALVARVVSWAAVGYLMTLGLLLPYWVSAANALFAAFLAMSLPNIRLRNTEAAKRTASLVGGISTAAAIVAKTPYLFLLMLQGVGIFILVRVLQVNLYQPIMSDKAFATASFGVIMSVMTIFEAFGSKLAHRVRSLSNDLSTVTVSTLILSFTLIGISLGNQVFVIAGFCIFSLAAGVAFPVQKQLLNDAITYPGQRATILSMESLIDRALCAVVVLPLGGFIADGKLQEVLIVCGLSSAVLAVVVQFFLKQVKQAAALHTESMLSDIKV